MILTLQDLLNAGVNAFAVRLLAKDFEKMTMNEPLPGPVHIPMPIAGGKVIWVSFSDVPPADPDGVAADARGPSREHP
ncbi:hypothetical protein [Hyalangium sp.]|uniref:hypothetical protein n=1 Tax=Hyalangium sp. TaxID=2028555 RepID=UPI002D42AD59|nr:hypothetical protein [Hyalangium sp.]HYH98406.1 hypothetical protein [Hyalangium sp.]